MDVLIIGGTRYMGRAVVKKLLERGDSVTVYSRGNTRPAWWDDVNHILGDRTDGEDFAAKLRGKPFDAVIDTQAFRKEHVETAGKTFEGSVGRYLIVSTGSVYMDGKLDFETHCPFKESDVEWSGIDYTYPPGESAYGVGKRHCEKWLQENSTVPFTVIRVPAVMGWDDPTGRMWWWVQRVLDGKGVVIPAENRAPFRSLYFEDAAENFIRAIDSPKAQNEIFHIATEEIFTIERWAYLISEAAERPCDITFVPSDVIARNQALSDYAPPISRPTPYIHDLSKAVSGFGFRTTPVAQWIQETVDWYREHTPDDAEGYAHRQAEIDLAASWTRAFRALERDHGKS
jgi:nucleoside-diphosphate-sugar epimerase